MIRQNNIEKFRKVLAMYEAGGTLNSISTDMGIPVPTVHRWLKVGGVKIRGRGDWHRGRSWTSARRSHNPRKKPVDHKKIKKQRAIKRFWALVGKPDANGCRNWQGHVMNNGYGRIKFLGEAFLAHRLAWLLVNGSIPEDKDSHHGTMSVCHHCDNPLCCELEHLFLGTHADNMADCHRKGRFNTKPPANPVRGSKSGAAKLTEQIVIDARREHLSGSSISALARKHDVDNSVMNRAINGKTWSHVT